MALNAPSASSSFEAANDYQAIPASTTAVLQGQKGTKGGAIGDYLRVVTIIPATTTPGAVTLQDGGGAAMTVFVGGTVTLLPFQVFLDIRSNAGPWKIVTGAAVSVVVSGDWQ